MVVSAHLQMGLMGWKGTLTWLGVSVCCYCGPEAVCEAVTVPRVMSGLEKKREKIHMLIRLEFSTKIDLFYFPHQMRSQFG